MVLFECVFLSIITHKISVGEVENLGDLCICDHGASHEKLDTLEGRSSVDNHFCMFGMVLVACDMRAFAITEVI